MSPIDPSTASHKRKGSIWRTAKVVMWSFIGLRGKNDYEKDVEQLNPVHIVVLGLVGGVIFVVALVLLATWVVSH